MKTSATGGPCLTPEQQVAAMMAVLDDMKVPADPDPVNRLKRLTSNYTALAFGIKKIHKAAKCLRQQAKMNKGW